MGMMPPWVTETIRKMAQPHIEAGLRHYKSAAEVLRGLREAGLGYRTAEFYRDWRWWKDVIAKGSGMKYLRKDITIPRHWYLQTIAEWGTKYATRYIVQVFNEATKKIEERGIWVKHDELEPREELERKLMKEIIPISEPSWIQEGRRVVGAYPAYGLESTSY